MSSAKIKRHLKLILKHPLQFSYVPVLVTIITSTYMLALGVFYIGYKSGESSQLMYSVFKDPADVILETPSVKQQVPVYNAEPNTEEELLNSDETDEDFEKDMNELLMGFDKNIYAYEDTNNVVLGTSDSDRPAGVPVERRIYNDTYKNQTQPDVNVITPNDPVGLFSFKNVVVPVLALGFAILGINYLEHKHLNRKKLALTHKKHSK